MPVCEYCGFGPHTKMAAGRTRGHWRDCPNHPEIARARKTAEKVVAAMLERRKRRPLPTSSKQMGQLTLAPRRRDGKTVEGFFPR